MEHNKIDSDNLLPKLEKAKSELTMFAEITNAMRTTLKLDQILFIILTAVTAHEGLGFNRAMLFLVNKNEDMLEGIMGIGPKTGEEANAIWGQIEDKDMSLDDLISAYSEIKRRPPTALDRMVQSMKIPLKEEEGIIALTALEGVPFEITDNKVRNKMHDAVLEHMQIDHFVSVPLKTRDKVLGVLVADNAITKKPITKNELKILYMFANQAGLAIENSRLYEESLKASKQDSLTGLWNHGHFQHFFSQLLEYEKSKEGNLSFVLFDIDNFKEFNDTYGHQAGDLVLRTIANILKETVRKTDFVARYGGEELAIILPGVKKENAIDFANRQKEKISNYNFNISEKNLKITVSGGVASYPIDAYDKNQLIESADKALYQAKKMGKNVICSGEKNC